MSEKTAETSDTFINDNKIQSPISQEKILVVDDEKIHLYSLMKQISQLGYNVDSVNNGEDAIKYLKSEPIGVILLDLNLEGVDGKDVMQFINQNNIDTTIIVVSGESSFEAAKNALKHGAYDFIRKPFRIENLLISVNNAFKKRQLEADNRLMQAQLRESEKLHRYIVNKSPDIVYILDDNGHFTFINKRVESLLGYKMHEIIGQHYSEIIHKDDLNKAEFKFNERRTGRRASINIELKLLSKNSDQPRSFDNRLLPIEINSVGVYSNENTDNKKFVGTYGVARDITERIEAEKIIRFQAYHDMLTRLPNRSLLKDRLNQALAHAKRNNTLLSVMFLDLDRFKLINDTLGHIIGDHLLQAVAQRLRDCLREGDTLARIGGDEFTLLLPEVHSRKDSEHIARKINNSLRTPFLIDNNELFISASIGISHYPEDGTSIEQLIKHADIAMYSVKGNGKNGYQFYNNQMIDKYSRHLSLENDLRRALEDKQFQIYYQPQINIETGEIFAMEALIRWQHPQRGLIHPDEFIELAEETHLIKQIGNWILRTACAELFKWRKMGLEHIRVAVNVSAVQLEQTDFVDYVISVLENYNLPGDCLEIEITENTLMDDTDNGINKLKMLSEYNIKLAIDDFGTGYSSLNYLKRLPIDTIKIDQSFIKDMSKSEEDASIIKAIIAMAKGLNLNIISEGVETEQQKEQLRQWRCQQMQGFLFGHPMPYDEAVEMLKNHFKEMNA